MTASIYIETAGCAFNAADSESMAGVLKREGFRLEEKPVNADLVILNTCTVKDRTFLNFRKRLSEFREGGEDGRSTPVVVTGCIPPAYRNRRLLDDISTVDPDSIDRISEAVRETLDGRVVHVRSDGPLLTRAELPSIRRNPVVEILPIARGCLSACAFCQTRLSRGRLASFPAAAILEKARRALDDGVKELWVTGQDTGVWGMDIDSSLPELVRSLLRLPGDFRIRLGMTSPQWITPRLQEYLDLFDHPKMFRFFHIPVQSGSDDVLRRMKREGSVAEFERIARRFRERQPDGSLLTDLIAGFPGEGDSDFESTLALVERLALPGINVSRFSPRPGTSGARMPPCSPAVIAKRTKRLVSAVRVAAAGWHRSRVGRRFRVLVDLQSHDGTAQGRNEAYRSVRIDKKVPLGRWVDVEIDRAADFSFSGRVLGCSTDRGGAVNPG